METAEPTLVREGLKAPRAGAVAGILFSILLLTSLVLLRSAVPDDPADSGAWLPSASRTVSFALALLPFAGVGFLWFIGVLRDRMGPLEDRFFASVFLGSGILFLATLFVSAAVASAVLMSWGATPGRVLETGLYHFGRTLVYNLINVHAMRMAAVFMVSTCTISKKLRLFPDWTALLGYALALLILLSGGKIFWAPMVFPLWTLLVSVQILTANLRRTPPRSSTVGLAVAALLLASGTAEAFDSRGHNVIEALAYRTLAEGREGEPARPDVLRDLLNDGALEPPTCFGTPGSPSRLCLDAAEEDPLLLWPRPRTDRPDAFFRRQFSDPGQCFHYMALLADARSAPLPNGIPRDLATRAVVRCNDLLDDLLRQVVVDGGPGVRRSGSGLYEMMHAVADSFSYAHTEREKGGDVDYLRVWKPIERLARIPTERTKDVPRGVYHVWDDHRDKTYVVEGEPAHCEARVDNPYDVTYECLSDEGDRARRALAELLVVVRDLRIARLSAAPGADTEPERSTAWRAYRAKWFTPVHPCEGAECGEKQPADTGPGRYSFLGAYTLFNPTADSFEVGARAAVFKFTEAFNPFVYSVAAGLGYRHYRDGSDVGVGGLSIDLTLPVGFKASVGFTPAALRVVFGKKHSGPEFVTRLLRFDARLSENLFLSVDGPLEVTWLEPRADWSVGVGLNWTPESSRLAGGPILLRHSEKTERRDGTWTPPPAPYGRLTARATSVLVVSGFTVDGTPEVAAEGRKYGLGEVGAELTWDRDHWGGRFPWAPAAHLSVGMRRTQGDSAYLTGVLAAEVRWFPVRPLGLSLTPVRVEGGPKVGAKAEIDGSPGVHGDPGSEYYFRAGSRLGIVLRAGILEFLVEGPTLAWASQPFAGKEVLSVRLGIGLK